VDGNERRGVALPNIFWARIILEPNPNEEYFLNNFLNGGKLMG
jgi:hypothetical protein